MFHENVDFGSEPYSEKKGKHIRKLLYISPNDVGEKKVTEDLFRLFDTYGPYLAVTVKGVDK